MKIQVFTKAPVMADLHSTPAAQVPERAGRMELVGEVGRGVLKLLRPSPLADVLPGGHSLLSRAAKDDIQACLDLVEEHTGAPFAWDLTIYESAGKSLRSSAPKPSVLQMLPLADEKESESEASGDEPEREDIDEEGNTKPPLALESVHLTIYPVADGDWSWCLTRYNPN